MHWMITRAVIKTVQALIVRIRSHKGPTPWANRDEARPRLLTSREVILISPRCRVFVELERPLFQVDLRLSYEHGFVVFLTGKLIDSNYYYFIII